MSFAKTIKEIYESQKDTLSDLLAYCEFAPEFDDDHLESQLNLLAENEEPATVLCYGDARAKGLLSLLSKSKFMFTEEYVYIESIKGGIKYSDISKISYKNETKAGLFKQKIEEFLVIEYAGKKEELKGNFASEGIANFLDTVVQRFKANPVTPTPKKEYPNVKKIVEAFEENKCEAFPYQIAPNISYKQLNKFIIHSAKEESKASIAGFIDYIGMPSLFFTNDFLYYKETTYYIWQRISYSTLTKATFGKMKTTDAEGNVKIEERVTLHGKDDEIIFRGRCPIEVANLINKVISVTTGQDIQTEIKTNIPISSPETEQQKSDIVQLIQKVSKYYNTSIFGFTFPEDIDAINEITSDYDASEVIAYTAREAVFLYNGFYISGLEQKKFFEYTQLSKITFVEGNESAKSGKLIFFDRNGQECFNQEFSSYYRSCRNNKGGKFSYDLVEVIYSINKEVFSNEIEIERIKNIANKVDGAACSDNEEIKKTWNDLLSKWDEIFTRDDNFESKEIEYKGDHDKFFSFQHNWEYWESQNMVESTFVSGNKAIWLKISKGWGGANPYENFNPYSDIEIIYTPDVNSKVEKFLFFCAYQSHRDIEGRYNKIITHYFEHLNLRFVSGEHSANTETVTHSELEISSASLEQLLKILDKEDVYNHFLSFVKKLTQEEISSIEKTKRQATEDLSNW